MKNFAGDGDNDLSNLVKSTLDNAKMQKIFNRQKEGGIVERNTKRVQFQTRKMLKANPGKYPALRMLDD